MLLATDDQCGNCISSVAEMRGAIGPRVSETTEIAELRASSGEAWARKETRARKETQQAAR